jgi:hypothetical protein
MTGLNSEVRYQKHAPYSSLLKLLKPFSNNESPLNTPEVGCNFVTL